MTQNWHVCAICCWVEADCDAISSRNVKTIVGYVVVDFEVGEILKQETHQLVGQAKRRATKIRLEAAKGGIFDSFFLDNSQPEVVGHVISDVAAE